MLPEDACGTDVEDLKMQMSGEYLLNTFASANLLEKCPVDCTRNEFDVSHITDFQIEVEKEYEGPRLEEKQIPSS